MLTEICARLDPEPGNPWPCHWSKSGATIAVTLEAYEAVGGMPAQPTGEDHAFIDAIIARDLVVRHDPWHRRHHLRPTRGAGDRRCS